MIVKKLTAAISPNEPRPARAFPLQPQKPAARGLTTRVADDPGPTFKWVVAFCAVHMGLAWAVRTVRPLAAVHALVTLAFGLSFCLRKNKPIQIVQWAAYVVGAEVLWRMCKAAIPWEFAKLSISLVCMISMFRAKGIRGSWLPTLYFGLLFPASFLTLVGLSLDEARQQISFVLAGPFCLAVFALWSPSLRLTVNGFLRVGVALMAPILGVAFLVVFRLATTEVNFTSGVSVGDASGGYGPNQISSMFSLGALMAVFGFLGEKRTRFLQVWFGVAGLWLLGQSLLTFSRTGIYLFAASFGFALIFLVQWKEGKWRLLFLAAILGGSACVIFPMLNSFTGGTLVTRMNDTGLTGRDSIAKMDFQIFLDHPLFGVGAGMSTYYRAVLGDDHAAHTEYSRLLADHGLLGLAALVVLLIMTGSAYLRASDPWSKAIVVALAVWAFLFMSVTAMRLAAPSFLLGLIHARFVRKNRAGLTIKKVVRRSRIPRGVPPPSGLSGSPAKNRLGTVGVR